MKKLFLYEKNNRQNLLFYDVLVIKLEYGFGKGFADTLDFHEVFLACLGNCLDGFKVFD